jgi:transposase
VRSPRLPLTATPLRPAGGSTPEMTVALLLYGYCQGERSSRVIEKRCVRDVGYRVITGGLCPDHATIARVPGEA